MPIDTMGARIQRARELAGDLSGRELARLAGLSEATVGHLERETSADATASTVAALAIVLGCSVGWLVLGRGHRPLAADVRAAVARARRRAA